MALEFAGLSRFVGATWSSPLSGPFNDLPGYLAATRVSLAGSHFSSNRQVEATL